MFFGDLQYIFLKNGKNVRERVRAWFPRGRPMVAPTGMRKHGGLEFGFVGTGRRGRRLLPSLERTYVARTNMVPSIHGYECMLNFSQTL